MGVRCFGVVPLAQQRLQALHVAVRARVADGGEVSRVLAPLARRRVGTTPGRTDGRTGKQTLAGRHARTQTYA